LLGDLLEFDRLEFHSRLKTLPAEFAGNVGQRAIGLLSSYAPNFRNMTLSVDAR
jgi:hypothetical protein